VSALARYLLTANSASRLQFDFLGGFTLENQDIRSTGIQTNYEPGAAPTSTNYSLAYSLETLLLTGGLGTLYRLNSHFELTYELTVNKALSEGSTLYNNHHLLTTSHALGLRYRFGR